MQMINNLRREICSLLPLSVSFYLPSVALCKPSSFARLSQFAFPADPLTFGWTLGETLLEISLHVEFVLGR